MIFDSQDDIEINLSKEQEIALASMLSGKNCFISGSAGVGKTAVIQAFKNKFKGNCAIVAPTGIAALNVGGQTIHSFFMLPPGLLNLDTLEDIPWARKKEIIRQTNCIIIDEISMVRSDMFTAIDLRLRQCAKGPNKRKPFGGKQIIVCGDFFQLPPVVSSAVEDEWLKENLGGEYSFQTKLWNDARFEVIFLKTAFRQNDPKFLKMLNNIRHGKVEEKSILVDGAELTAPEALNKLCADGSKKMPKPPIRLCTTNREAQAVNNEARAKINAEPYKFNAVIKGKFNESDYPTEAELVLKVGCRVMVLCNSHKPKGGFFYVNGDCGIVEDIRDSGELSEVKIALDNGNTVWISCHEWKNTKYKLELDRMSGRKIIRQEEIGSFMQIPLRLAYATTIHKSQGMTLESVELRLGNGCFAHGQLYTALSRARSLDGLKLGREIFGEDLILDERVVNFYNKIEREEADNPLNALDGESSEVKKLEVPTDMYEEMQKMLDAMKKEKQTKMLNLRSVMEDPAV